MTLKIIEGFENLGPSGLTGTPLQDALSKRYACDTTASTDAILVDGWGSGTGLKWAASSGAEYLQMEFLPGARSITIGFALKTPIYTTSMIRKIFSLFDGVSTLAHLQLYLTVNNYLGVYDRSNTFMFSSNQSLRSNQWTYIEVKTWLDTTASGLIELRINGVVDTLYNGISAYLTNNASVLVWYGAAFNCVLDDIYVATSPDGLDGYKGPSSVETLRPSADEGHNDWTPSSAVDHYTLVNTVPVNMSNYLTGLTGLELFDYENTSLETIEAVKISSEVTTDAASVSQVRQVYQGVNTHSGDTFNIIATEPFEIKDIFELNPDTANSWSPSDLNSSQFGVERL